MLPAPGRYRLTSTTPAGASAVVTVTATGMDTTFGHFAYDPVGDLFAMEPGIFVKCLGTGTFIATQGPNNFSGTCVPI